MRIVSTVTGRRPLRADAERNRHKILEAAADLFALHGIDITLDDVARHAKVGVGTVYRRFACKQDLVDGVFERHMELVAEGASAALECDDPWLGLRDYLAFTCEQMALNRGLADVLFSQDEGRAQVACARERVTPLVEKLIERAHSVGVLRSDVGANDLFTVCRMVESIIDFTRPVAPDAWRRYFELALDGLRAEGSPREPLSGPALSDQQIEDAKAGSVRR
ncbi:AcrR family transcriptional regulator [Rhodococcus sp. 27YEA15]|uniref:TetR/AcrR family transcriptional regulator n=1 Tax=Rhodococcus sp. 27YEA15 TaxID=3156259 RepID=UPI003C7C43F9